MCLLRGGGVAKCLATACCASQKNCASPEKVAQRGGGGGGGGDSDTLSLWITEHNTRSIYGRPIGSCH